MNQVRAGYLLGIGSNIQPELNVAEIIRLLLKPFSKLSLSRVLKIPPVGMNSHRDFYNLVVFIETTLSELELKAICNRIEINLGRDRSDPARKTKDRTADLDILTSAIFPNDGRRLASSITDEYFLYPLIDEMTAYLSSRDYLPQQTGVEIAVDDLTFGQAPTTIYRDAGTSNEWVIQ